MERDCYQAQQDRLLKEDKKLKETKYLIKLKIQEVRIRGAVYKKSSGIAGKTF